MSCYWIARAKILEPVEYKKYTDLLPAILKEYGGKVLTRGGRHETLEGSTYFERFSVIEFESMAAAKRCFESSAYASAAAFRNAGAGDNQLTIVEASGADT